MRGRGLLYFLQMMPKRRRRPIPPKQTIEEELLSKGRWSGVKEQWAREAVHHTESENIEAHEKMRRVLDEGFGADEDYQLWLYHQK